MEPHLTVFVFSSPGIESSLESQTDMESTGQQSDDASLPSTSQDPGNLFILLTIITASLWTPTNVCLHVNRTSVIVTGLCCFSHSNMLVFTSAQTFRCFRFHGLDNLWHLDCSDNPAEFLSSGLLPSYLCSAEFSCPSWYHKRSNLQCSFVQYVLLSADVMSLCSTTESLISGLTAHLWLYS